MAIALRLRDEIHLPEGPHLETIRNGLQALALDLGYLSDELKSSMKKVDDVKKLAVDQMEIFDKRRNKVIGTLIAVYVPLAFATVSAICIVFGWHSSLWPVFLLNEHRG